MFFTWYLLVDHDHKPSFGNPIFEWFSDEGEHSWTCLRTTLRWTFFVEDVTLVGVVHIRCTEDGRCIPAVLYDTIWRRGKDKFGVWECSGMPLPSGSLAESTL